MSKWVLVLPIESWGVLYMDNNNYITIQGWMVNELRLSGNDLICYALIYGFTQNGCYWDKSASYIANWLGVSKRTVFDILKRLVEKKLIEQQECVINGVKFCKYKADVQNFIGSEESALGGSEESALYEYNNIENKEKEIEDKSSIEKKIDAFVEKMYSLYPSRCPLRKTSLGKSHKHKAKIKALLKTYSMQDIEKVFRCEVESKYNKLYISNFATFLNNFPDPSQIELAHTDNVADSDKTFFNGVEYR